MREYNVEKKLKKKLSKLMKRDIKLYSAVLSKMDEIVCCSDVGSYKNLKRPMQRYKRVQIGSFVLIFNYDKSEDSVTFFELEHHDDAYK